MRVTKLLNSTSFPVPKLRGSLSAIKFPAFGEVKYDGEFTFIFYGDGKIATMNKYNKVRTDFPMLNGIRDNMKCDSAVMLAELFYADGKRNRLYDLNSNKESDDLGLSVFDLLECDGVNLQKEPLIDRKEKLIEVCRVNIRSKMLMNKADAHSFFQWTVNEGYEGAVIKSLDSPLVEGPCSWVKMKMKDRSDYTVGLVDTHKERIVILVPAILNGRLGEVSVGCKASLRYKRHIKVGDKVTVEHQGVLASGKLRHPVLIAKKEWK